LQDCKVKGEDEDFWGWRGGGVEGWRRGSEYNRAHPSPPQFVSTSLPRFTQSWVGRSTAVEGVRYMTFTSTISSRFIRRSRFSKSGQRPIFNIVSMNDVNQSPNMDLHMHALGHRRLGLRRPLAVEWVYTHSPAISAVQYLAPPAHSPPLPSPHFRSYHASQTMARIIHAR